MTTKAQVAVIRDVEHYVYRCYDAAGHLLYVGCSMNPKQRLKEHRYYRTWWTDRIARVALEGFSDQAAGLAAEKQAIQTGHPIHNRQFRTTDAQRANWQPEHYVNWLTALLEDPASDRSNPIVRREVNRAAEDYLRRFGRNLRKEVGRVRVGYRNSDALRRTPQWRAA
jgi:predicted GIY-YIG superfamily endonuclease